MPTLRLVAAQGRIAGLVPADTILLHGSSAAMVPSSRRVIHLEFTANELPDGVEWGDRV